MVDREIRRGPSCWAFERPTEPKGNFDFPPFTLRSAATGNEVVEKKRRVSLRMGNLGYIPNRGRDFSVKLRELAQDGRKPRQ